MGRLASVCALGALRLLAWVAPAGASPDVADACVASACAAAAGPFAPDEAPSGMSLLQFDRAPTGKAPPKHLWTNRAGDLAASSSVPYAALADLTVRPAWTWANELGEQVRHSPLIDADRNVYICTTSRLRKFDSDGRALWTHHDPSWRIRTAPVLYRQSVYVVSDGVDDDHIRPKLSAISLDSGEAEWTHDFGRVHRGRDAQGMLVFDEKVVFGVLRGDNSDGTDTIMAASAVDGSHLWEYTTDEIMWNFSPASPGDGTLLFSSSCGGVYRLGADGELVWRAGPHHPNKMCSNGGGALGPDGVFYTTYRESDNKILDAHPYVKVAAYSLSDGKLRWHRQLPFQSTNYPAVGRLGPHGPVAVALGVGDTVLPPVPFFVEQPLLAVKGSLRNWLVALDADTGETLWKSEERRWPTVTAAGERDAHNLADGKACWPDNQAIPVIAGDGTVYAASGHSGDLRAIRDKDGDGVISPLEVSTFAPEKCFLNSPSLAPGMLVAAPCWGPTYVFKA